MRPQGRTLVDKAALPHLQELYADDVAELFKLRDFPSPVNFQHKTNEVTIIIRNLKKEEDIATQRLPLDDRIHAELVRMGKDSRVDSAEAVVSNIVSTGKSIGYRAIEYPEYLNSEEIMTALNGNDVISLCR